MSNKITEEHIKSLIADVKYHRFEGTTVTACLMTLKNGYNILGESACADPNNFDEEVGRNLAYSHAFNQIWPLEGYRLKQRLFEESQNAKTS